MQANVPLGLSDFLQQNTGDLSIRDIRQGQYDAISCVCICLFRSIVTMAVSVAGNYLQHGCHFEIGQK